MVEQRLSPALKAVSDAVLAVASKLSVEEVLQRLVDSARELADARYAALGIPDGEGGFRRFLVSGMSDQLIAAMGPLPSTHGMLGAMLDAAAPYRTEDIHEDPRFRGWWPKRHPDMRSFLGVPIVSADGVIGAFYLTEKQGAATFDADDEAVIELLASHAAIAITNARLYERSRELSIISERNRLALGAPRRGQPEAVQRDAHRRSRRRPARSRPRRCPRSARAHPRAGPRIARRAALADPWPPPARARARRPRGRASQGARDARPHPRDRDRPRGRGSRPTPRVRTATGSASSRSCESPTRR